MVEPRCTTRGGGWLGQARLLGVALASLGVLALGCRRQTRLTSSTSAAEISTPPTANSDAVETPVEEDLVDAGGQCLPPPGQDARPRLVATARRTPIFSRPDVDSDRLGYLRAGQTVVRGAEPIRGEGCRRFYSVEPRGYVCVGIEASLDLDHPARKVCSTDPNQRATLPFTYGLSRYPTPPLYTRVPTKEEQSRTEPGLERYLPRRDMSEWLALGIDEVPGFLLDHASSYHPSGIRKGRKALTEGNAFVESGFAFVRRFEVEGRYYGLTTDLEVLPLDRLNPVSPSKFRGVELGTNLQLPVAFIREEGSQLLSGEPDLGLRGERELGYREVIALSGMSQHYAGEVFWQTKDGLWVKQTSRVTVVETRSGFPSWTKPGRTWVDVSLLRQTLVAYDGQDAKYVTLVSSGRDGVADAAGTHATLQGQFIIHTKHLTAPMMGSGPEAAFDLRDVPYVQYFSGGYALHAAYWHDGFGQPKSHGCINLSPLDAKWLFNWTEPRLPEGWHGVLADGGTWVTIHR